MANNRKLPSSPLAVVVIAIIVIMLIPLPATALYILIALNLIMAILIFLIALFSKKITDFSLLPTYLLVSIIFGLAVNIFSARLILIKGAAFDGWAIQAVASLAAASGDFTRLIIIYAGFIVFAAFLIIVITKCTTRVSEAAALFILNVMQVKIMIVEYEYSSGSITEEEAQKRKAPIHKEADFYGTMDGAVKFISGSVKIVIFIMAVTILGGIGFNVLLRDESFAGVVNTYIPLSILNGLQFLLQIFLLSIAAYRSVPWEITKMPKVSHAEIAGGSTEEAVGQIRKNEDEK